MLAESILLQFLLIFTPIVIYNIFFENKRIGKSPYLQGLLQGGTVFISFIFSFTIYGNQFNLSIVPLILSFLYGGSKSGFVTIVMFFFSAMFFGGEDYWIEMTVGVFIACMSIWFLKQFWTYTYAQRIKWTIVAGFTSQLIFIIIQGIVSFTSSKLSNFKQVFIIEIYIGILVLSALGFAAILNEKIVERRKLKKEISKAEKLHTIGELAASIAHEIRNPLTVVNGFLQIMRKEEKGNHSQYIQLIIHELNRAEMIINDYLNLAKPQLEKIEKVDLSIVLKEVCTVLEAYAIKNGVDLKHWLHQSIIVQSDRNQLKQVFVNIIKNAIEATPNGGYVDVRLTEKSSKAIITISDNGKGMSQEELDKIGTLFYTTKEFGTGLGTSVAISIIEKMNGKIHYSSEIGKGTTVEIHVPIN